MHRLASQQPGYIKNQLQAFIDRRRLNPVMGNVAHVLSPAMVDALSTHLRISTRRPMAAGPRDLMSEGEKTTMEAFPARRFRPRDVPWPGRPRHGPVSAPGRPARRLRDRQAGELVQGAWARPNNPDNSQVMGPIAEKLTKEQIAAIAAYVSDLK